MKNHRVPEVASDVRVTDLADAMCDRVGTVRAIEYGDWTRQDGTQVVVEFPHMKPSRYLVTQLALV